MKKHLEKMLVGSLIVNGVLLAVFAYIMVQLSGVPENTPPQIKFLFLSNTNSGATEIPADYQRPRN